MYRLERCHKIRRQNVCVFERERDKERHIDSYRDRGRERWVTILNNVCVDMKIVEEKW